MQGFRHWKWRLDEMYVTRRGGVANINGEMHYLWCAVDHEREILGSYVTRKRALKRHGRAMLRFWQMKSLQKFASVHANVHNHSHGEFLVKGA